MDHKDHTDEGDTCLLCKMHHALHQKNMCMSCMGYNHHGLLRIALAIAILVFVFWAGTEIGGMTHERGYDEYGGNGYGGYGNTPGMMLYRGDAMPNMMYGTVRTDAMSVPGSAAAPLGAPVR